MPLDLTVTDRATTAIKALCADRFVGLRIVAMAAGCSGLQYRMGLETAVETADAVMEIDGARLLIDPSSAPWLVGATLDYVDSSTGAGFVFDNPNAARACACGSRTC